MLRSVPTTPREDVSSGTLDFVSDARGSILEPEIFSLESLTPEDMLTLSVML